MLAWQVHRHQLHGQSLPAERLPQAHVEPVGALFSLLDMPQVHLPWARLSARGMGLANIYWRPLDPNVLHEQRAPLTLFSSFLRSQLHFIAGCLPQEHVASLAQTQPVPSLRPQQEVGTADISKEGTLLMSF